jgi:hypothetical protein
VHLAPGTGASDLVPTLVAGMLVDAVSWWLDQDPRPPREHIAAQTDRLAVAMLAPAQLDRPTRGREARETPADHGSRRAL